MDFSEGVLVPVASSIFFPRRISSFWSVHDILRVVFLEQREDWSRVEEVREFEELVASGGSAVTMQEGEHSFERKSLLP
jgi:hypothetical protein